MESVKSKWVNGFIIGTFVSLYILVSIVSTIHVVDFFELSNPKWLAVTLAIGFELGAAASLAALITLDKMNKTLVWSLFIIITAMQMQGNMYYAFINMEDFSVWAELFDLIDEEPLHQKRILSFVSGAILPLVALGFIKSLVDYVKPTDESPVLDETSAEKKTKVDRSAEETDPLEEWDEDHALDMAMNDMVKDFTPEDIAEIAMANENPPKPNENLIHASEDLIKKMPQTNLVQPAQESATLEGTGPQRKIRTDIIDKTK